MMRRLLAPKPPTVTSKSLLDQTEPLPERIRLLWWALEELPMTAEKVWSIAPLVTIRRLLAPPCPTVIPPNGRPLPEPPNPLAATTELEPSTISELFEPPGKPIWPPKMISELSSRPPAV